MVVMMIMGAGFKMAFPVVADFRFGLQDSMTDTVLLQLLAYQILYGLDIFGPGHDVHGGVVVVAVDAPYMDMMNILHTLYFQQMFLQLADIDIIRGFLQEQVQHRLKVLKGVDQDEQSDTDAHKRVYHPDVGEVHYDGTNQDYNPAQHILQHVEVHCLLVDGISLPGDISCHKVKYDPDDSKDNHSTVVYLHWIEKPSDRSDYDQDKMALLGEYIFTLQGHLWQILKVMQIPFYVT